MLEIQTWIEGIETYLLNFFYKKRGGKLEIQTWIEGIETNKYFATSFNSISLLEIQTWIEGIETILESLRYRAAGQLLEIQTWIEGIETASSLIVFANFSSSLVGNTDLNRRDWDCPSAQKLFTPGLGWKYRPE